MDIGFQIKGKAVARNANYFPTSKEVEEAIEVMFAEEMGVDIDVHVSDMYEVTA